LSHTPIDVYKLDSLIAEIKGSGDEVVANILNDKTKMALAEAAIVFANRDRNHLGEVDTLLQQTEGLYFSGDFNRSYEETLKELKRRHAGE
jgi:septation ring formation regulator EzrA